MTGDFLGIAITPDVMDVQHEMGSDGLWQIAPQPPQGGSLYRQRGSWRLPAGTAFYLATVSQTGWPYIQHRGGPPGFLHLPDVRPPGNGGF